MEKFRSEQEMTELIVNTAAEDDRIIAAVMTGSRADTEAPADNYRDYDIVYFVREVRPFWNDREWLEEKFGRTLMIQTPETMTLLPPDGDGKFVFLAIFEDGNRIDLTITDDPDYINENDPGEPAMLLLDKENILPPLDTADGFWHIKPPTEKLFRDCCNEFWWCLNNVAKGIARDQLPYAMSMFNGPVRSMLDKMVEWHIGAHTYFSVSAGKSGKYFKKYLTPRFYEMYMATYSDGEHIWNAVETAMELFALLAVDVAYIRKYVYDISEEDGICKYIKAVKDGFFSVEN